MAPEGEADEVGDSVHLGVALFGCGSGFAQAAEMGLLPEIGAGRLTACEEKRERTLVRIVVLNHQGSRLFAGR